MGNTLNKIAQELKNSSKKVQLIFHLMVQERQDFQWSLRNYYQMMNNQKVK